MAAEIRGPSFKPGVGQNVALYVSPAAVYFALFFFFFFFLITQMGTAVLRLKVAMRWRWSRLL